MGMGSPFAIAMKMGWFKQEGLEVEQSYLELIHKTSTIRVIG
jgi:hypothetical protein